ncbi:VOC family protein [Nocardia wallacei]|uniref:VOC family protein n=1 Tax=Nocardia wallacei TaxID=480035 RepID=UPI002456C0B6|nr:VOC family protein [Nocardia wallacei]
MANEVAIPLLPCRDIDEIVEFYTMLGFTRTYRQVRPNPYVSLEREDLRLDFFGMPGEFDPENSYGTCAILVPDTAELFEAFAAGMRRVHGRLLVSGIPRMTRPRKRRNAENRSGFTVVDPGGNWIRIMAAKPGPEQGQTTRRKLTTALNRAVVIGDSHGKPGWAAEILDTALEHDGDTATTAEVLRALAYRAELALRAQDRDGAVDTLARARAVPLTDAERDTLAETLAALDDVEAVLAQPAPQP